MFASAWSSALNVSHHVVGNSGGRLCRVFASAWSASVAWRSPYVSYRTSHAPVRSTGSAMALMPLRVKETVLGCTLVIPSTGPFAHHKLSCWIYPLCATFLLVRSVSCLGRYGCCLG